MPSHTLPKYTPEGERATGGTVEGGDAAWRTLAHEGGLRGGRLPPSHPPAAPRSPSRPLVAPARHHNRSRPHNRPCPRPHGCGSRNEPAVPPPPPAPLRMGVNFQHTRLLPRVHKFPTDAAQKQALRRARFPSQGNQSNFSLIYSPSHRISQIKTPPVLPQGFAASEQPFIRRWSGCGDWKRFPVSWGGRCQRRCLQMLTCRALNGFALSRGGNRRSLLAADSHGDKDAAAAQARASSSCWAACGYSWLAGREHPPSKA